MPDSPAGSQAIIDRLRASVPTKGLDDPWIRLADAEAAVRDTRDATVKEIVDALRLASVVTGPDTAADFIARRFPNGGTHNG
mgnify:CR=1 FL=1